MPNTEGRVESINTSRGGVPKTAVLDALVTSESPSDDPARLAATTDLVAGRGTELLGREPERLASTGPRCTTHSPKVVAP